MKTRTHLLAVLALAVALAACSADEEIALPCPAIAPLPDTTEMTRFNGAGRDLTDVDFSAEISNVNFVCDYEETSIEMSMQVVFEANRGPANESGQAQFGYFVAISKSDTPEQVLTRQEFPVTLEFEGNRRRLLYLDELEQRFPLAPGEDGNSYVIYLGLMLTRAELDYNRANR